MTPLLMAEQYQLDPEVSALVSRAFDLLAANTMWRWLIEIAKSGEPVTLRTVHDVAEGVRIGALV